MFFVCRKVREAINVYATGVHMRDSFSIYYRLPYKYVQKSSIDPIITE